MLCTFRVMAFTMMSAVGVFAGSLQWGETYVIDMGYGGEAVNGGGATQHFAPVFVNFDRSPEFYVSSDIGLDVIGRTIVLKAMKDHVLYWGTTLVQMDLGDIVNYSTTLDNVPAFYSFYCLDDGSEDTLSDYDVTLPYCAEQNVYFGFATNITPDGNASFLYGWLGLTVTPTSISIFDAAINPKGGAIVVGQLVPEPSTTALIALGLVAIAVSRRFTGS